VDIAEILARAKPPEKVVELCLDADLAAEHDRLTAELENAQRTVAVTMADSGKLGDLARQIQDVEQKMTDSKVSFRMRGLSAFKRDEWFTANPAREGKSEGFNPVTGLPSLIAACCVDPAMTVAQAQQLCERLGTGQADKLFSAALDVTNSDGAVPFSVVASATLRATAPKQ
jgi:hypothetical protein